MRFALLLLAGVALAPIASAPARAATLPPVAVQADARDIVEAARVNCGRYAHYVRGHRNRHGEWIRGQCVRNRPR